MIARTAVCATNAHTAPVVTTMTSARIADTANGVADVTTYGTTKTMTKTKSVLNN